MKEKAKRCGARTAKGGKCKNPGKYDGACLLHVKRFALEEFTNKRTRRDNIELAVSVTSAAVTFAPHVFKVIEYVLQQLDLISRSTWFLNRHLLVISPKADDDSLARVILRAKELEEPLSEEGGEVLLVTFNIWFEQLPVGMKRKTRDHFGAEWIEQLRRGKVT